MFVKTTKFKEIGNKKQIRCFSVAWLSSPFFVLRCPRLSRWLMKTLIAAQKWLMRTSFLIEEIDTWTKGKMGRKSWEKVREEKREWECEGWVEWSARGGFYSWLWLLKIANSISQRDPPWLATHMAKLRDSTFLKIA